MKIWIWIAAFVTIVVGCSGKSETPSYAPIASNGGNNYTSTGGKQSTGGKSGTSTAGNGGVSASGGSNASGGSGASTGGTSAQVTFTTVAGSSTGGAGGSSSEVTPPTVVIESPPPLNSPDDSGVIVDSSVDVLCLVTPGTAGLDTSKIKIEMLDASGNPLPKPPSTNSTNNPGEYKTTFPLNSTIIAAGKVSFRCSAADQSNPPNSVSAIVSTFVDYGPAISVVSPAPNSSVFALGSAVQFQFNVTPVLLTATDQHAGIASVQFNVLNQSIPWTQNAQGVYVAIVDFSKFSPTPSGTVPYTITATNQRLPTGAESQLISSIGLDGTSPVIALVTPTPAPNSVIGNGQRIIAFTVTDETGGSGVNPNSIIVSLGLEDHPYDPTKPEWSYVSGVYELTFNASDFSTVDAQITIKVQASDYAGNVAAAVTRPFYLDNVPPFVSLDPANTRVVYQSSNITYCSAPFDPLGPKAVNNGDVVTSSYIWFRALVWDLTNQGDGQETVYYSGVNPAQVHLYLLPVSNATSNTPLIVNSGKTTGTACDSIEPNLKSSSSSIQTQLSPVGVTPGNFTVMFSTDYAASPDVSSLNCHAGSNPTSTLCNNYSDMTFALYQNFPATGNTASAIYAWNISDNLSCNGAQWNIRGAGQVPDGWVCAAVEALDNLGNVGISYPLAFCLDTGSSPACANSSTPIPQCTDGCTPPSRSVNGDLDGSGNVVRVDMGNPLPYVISYK